MQQLAGSSVALAGEPRIAAILQRVCDLTGMGFAAVARVTEERWTACQVLDRVDFGLDAGDELELQTTICNDIRDHRKAVVFDQASGHAYWRNHPTPVLYGFESYIALPIMLSDGQFFGTLCALDPEPRKVEVPGLVAMLHELAEQLATILESPATPAQSFTGIPSPR